MNVVTMSRAGAIVRLILQTLIAFGGAVLALVQASPDHVLRWWDWVSCVMAGLFAAQAFVNKAWAASSADAPPLPSLAGVAAPLLPPAASPQAIYNGLAPAPVRPQAPAPVSGPPGAAQGVSGQGFLDVAAEDDGHDLIGGEEQPPK